jgi:hypothetical protein
LEEPTELQKTLIEEGIYLRGKVIAAYAQVEFMLADISVKLDLRFPYLIKERIKAVRHIAEREGYEVYKAELDRVCDELLRYDDLRHFMAHGFMMLMTDPAGNHRFDFRRYQREGDGKFSLVIGTGPIEQLRQAVSDITLYVSHAMTLFERIYIEQKLEA